MTTALSHSAIEPERARRKGAGAWARAIACLLALCFVGLALAADGDLVAVPKLATRVTDLTNTLSSGQKSSLESKVAAWEGRTGGQFAVLLVPTTKPEDIDQFSQRVTDEWKLGRKGIDDGILLLIAKNDKKLRLQVGKGFEGTLTDVTSKRIIDEVIVPAFRKNDFAGGIDAGVDKAIAVAAGEKLPAPSRSTSFSSSSTSSHDWIGDWLGFVIFAGLGLFWVAASTLNRLFGRVGGSVVGGAAAGLLGWFLTSLVIVGVGAGIGVFLFLLIALASRGIGGGWMPGGFGHYGGGGFSGGGGGGGSSSWSGGGGDFGGGGASGSWGDSGGGGGDSGGGGGSDS